MRKVFYILFALITLKINLSADPICAENSINTALVVIDMQPGFVTRGGNHNDSENKAKFEKIINEQVAMVKRAKDYQIPIIFLEYEGDYGDTNSKLKESAKNYPNVRYFKKSSDGMFEDYNKYRKELVDYVKAKNIGTLVITGANGGACVRSSIDGALKNNCNVIAVSSGIADFNYKDFIYPYAGKYSNLKAKCSNCSFKEVSRVDDAGQFMVNYPRQKNKNVSEVTGTSAQQ